MRINAAYESAIRRLDTRWERAGVSLGIDHIVSLLDSIGNPHRSFTGALVAGTNGKGSTVAFLERIAREHGLSCGSMPSPHLVEWTERIQVRGRPISQEHFASLVHAVCDADDARDSGSSTFEILTAAAFLRFAKDDVDLAVVEVGLGGRLDATNVFRPPVKIVTSIGLDHQAFLGSDLPSIAAEKAGVIWPGDDVVIGALHPAATAVIRQRASDVGATVHAASDVLLVHDVSVSRRGSSFKVQLPDGSHEARLNLRGRHQVENAVVAASSWMRICARLGISLRWTDVLHGLAQTNWAGRLETISLPGGREVLLDGAHNVDGMTAMVEYVSDVWSGRVVGAVFGCLSDKDAEGMLKTIPASWNLALVSAPDRRAMAAVDLAAICGRASVVHEGELRTPIDAMATECDLTVVCGSLTIVGEARRVLRAAHS